MARLPMRYRTAQDIRRSVQSGDVSLARGQYLARRALKRTARSGQGRGRARARTNYANPVIQDGERIN